MQVQNAIVDHGLTHLCDQVLSDLSDSNIIILDWLQQLQPPIWDMALCPSSSPYEGGVSLNWHNSRNNWDRDSDSSDLLYPVQENVDIVEHLSDDKGGSGINLFLQVLQEKIGIWLVVTSLWVSSNSNVEVIAILFSNVLDQIFGVTESSIGRLPFLVLSWWITAKLHEMSVERALRTCVIEAYGGGGDDGCNSQQEYFDNQLCMLPTTPEVSQPDPTIPNYSIDQIIPE